MWVFCCGPVRSGSTLQFNLTREIVENGGKGYSVDYDFPDNFPSVYENHQNDSKIKIFKTHSLTPFMIDLVKNNEAMCISSYRDVRDVIVSISKKENQPSDLLSRNTTFIKAYINHNKHIKALPNSFVSKYEDFYLNIEEECKRICSFLNISLTKLQIQRISDMNAYQNLKKTIDVNTMEDFVGRNGKTYTLDKKTLIHYNHFGNIHPKSYKNYLSFEEINNIEKVAGLWLFKNGYKANFFNVIKSLIK